MDNDGEIDYSHNGLDELREIEAVINHIQYPKNYANLMAAIESRLEERSKREAEQAALPPVDPLELSGKSAESVAREYRLTITRAKIVSAIVIVLWLPNLLSRYVNVGQYIGLGETAQTWIAIAAASAYGLFSWLFWKCPNCAKFPGGGWKRKHCKSCGVSLGAVTE